MDTGKAWCPSLGLHLMPERDCIHSVVPWEDCEAKWDQSPHFTEYQLWVAKSGATEIALETIDA